MHKQGHWPWGHQREVHVRTLLVGLGACLLEGLELLAIAASSCSDKRLASARLTAASCDITTHNEWVVIPHLMTGACDGGLHGGDAMHASAAAHTHQAHERKPPQVGHACDYILCLCSRGCQRSMAGQKVQNVKGRQSRCTSASRLPGTAYAKAACPGAVLGKGPK